MNGLTWFQARALARVGGRAIRRATWEKWILYRGSTWVMDDGTPLHVVRATEFGAAEFLAKDWTIEAWEGGSYPPCTATGPVTAIPPNPTGALGAWTTTGNCGGAGNGGGVLSEDTGAESPPVGLAAYLYPAHIGQELTNGSPPQVVSTDAVWLEDLAFPDGAWRYFFEPFLHYVVTGVVDPGVEIVGIAPLYDLDGTQLTPLDEANLVGADDYDSGTYDHNTKGVPFFGKTIATDGPSGHYYTLQENALGQELYKQPENTEIEVMVALRQPDGSFTDVQTLSFTLPPHDGAPVFWNEEQEFTATCEAGTHGDPVTVTIPAHTYTAGTLAAANAIALAAAEEQAEEGLVCEMDFQNEEVTATCEAGTHGDPVTIPAGTFSSPVSQAAANALAQAAAEAALVCEPD